MLNKLITKKHGWSAYKIPYKSGQPWLLNGLASSLTSQPILFEGTQSLIRCWILRKI